MNLPVRFIIFGAGLSLFLIIFELVRRKRFREELSLAWFFVAVLVMLSAVADLFLDRVAKFIGIYYPPALYFGWIIFCLVVTLLYFSSVISDLKSKIKELSQKIALLEFEARDSDTKYKKE
jgi:hypothetical protein